MSFGTREARAAAAAFIVCRAGIGSTIYLVIICKIRDSDCFDRERGRAPMRAGTSVTRSRSCRVMRAQAETGFRDWQICLRRARQYLLSQTSNWSPADKGQDGATLPSKRGGFEHGRAKGARPMRSSGLNGSHNPNHGQLSSGHRKPTDPHMLYAGTKGDVKALQLPGGSSPRRHRNRECDVLPLPRLHRGLRESLQSSD